jgi:hypothetical protein
MTAALITDCGAVPFNLRSEEKTVDSEYIPALFWETTIPKA